MAVTTEVRTAPGTRRPTGGYLSRAVRESTIVFGRNIKKVGRVPMVLQGVLVIVVALAMGASFKTGIVGVLVMLLLAACFGIVWAALSNIVALRTKNSEITMMIGILLTFPLLFLSTAMMPSGLLPG